MFKYFYLAIKNGFYDSKKLLCWTGFQANQFNLTKLVDIMDLHLSGSITSVIFIL